MRIGQITIKDIARELGISPSTVSRALKDHPDISPKTKKTVSELAARLNYQPNSVALSLRQSKTNTIGVIVPKIVHFFFSTVISGIEDIAYNAGYNIIICQSNESYDREVTDTKALFNSRVDGMLISISRESLNLDHFEELFSRGVPMVFFDRVTKVLDTSKVVCNDYQGAYDATVHLIEQGCKKIAHLAGPLNLLIGINRLQGYKKALLDHNLPYDDSLVRECRDEDEEAEQVTTKLLKSQPDIDGIFANNDLASLGAMNAIKNQNLRIPEDIAIIGFSDWKFSAVTEPALSTVSQKGIDIGREAAKLLIRQIELEEDEHFVPETKIIEPELVIRQSSLKSGVEQGV